MMSGKDIIEMIRECTTKEQLFTVFEETSNNEMKFWDESIYKTARGFLKQAMATPKHITVLSMDIFQKRKCLNGMLKYSLPAHGNME